MRHPRFNFTAVILALIFWTQQGVGHLLPCGCRAGADCACPSGGMSSQGGIEDEAHIQQLVLQRCCINPKTPLTLVKAPACDPMAMEQLYLEDTSPSAPAHPHSHQSHTLTALCALLDSGKWLLSIFENRSLGYVSPTSISHFSLF